MTNVGEIYVPAPQSINSGQDLTFQPAAGETYFILGVSSDKVNGTNGQLYISYGVTDGTHVSWFWYNGNTVGLTHYPVRFGINNTGYLIINNQAASSAYISFSALRIK